MAYYILIYNRGAIKFNGSKNKIELTSQISVLSMLIWLFYIYKNRRTYNGKIKFIKR